MKKFFWYFRMFLWCAYYERSIIGAFRYSFIDAWEGYRIDGYSPRKALLEDMSYV